MEGDMDMDQESKRIKRRTEWYEPEKDRKSTASRDERVTELTHGVGIVITSIGSPDSSVSSRSPSPTPSEQDRQAQARKLTQPGLQGFTLSPSLLTHLLSTQRDNLTASQMASMGLSGEKGLVLYRSPPNFGIVQEWPGQDMTSIVDEGRFEELDEDEITHHHNGMDQGRYNDDDDAMDVE